MQDLTTADIRYRLYRLRRLVGVALLPPFVAMFLVNLTGLGIGFGWSGTMIMALWTLAALYLTVRFPNGWVDIVAITLSLTLAILLSPVVALVDVGPILGTLLLAVFLIIGWFKGNSMLPDILSARMGEVENTFRQKVRMSPEDLRAATFMRPDAEVGLHTCGPADADGIFPVTANGYDLSEELLSLAGAEDLEGGITFRAKIVEGDDLRQVTQFMTDLHDNTIGTEEQVLTPVRGGTRYEKREVHDHFDRFAALGFWLQDFEADHFQAVLDHVQGRPPRAIKHATNETLLTTIATRMMGGMAEEAT